MWLLFMSLIMAISDRQKNSKFSAPPRQANEWTSNVSKPIRHGRKNI